VLESGEEKGGERERKKERKGMGLASQTRAVRSAADDDGDVQIDKKKRVEWRAAGFLLCK
jgi:hypothetical protein